jgi:hypothetical protein
MLKWLKKAREENNERAARMAIHQEAWSEVDPLGDTKQNLIRANQLRNTPAAKAARAKLKAK